MKLTCSCGATLEVQDNIAGAVDARRWSEDHAICRTHSGDVERLMKERDALAAENLTLRNAAVNASEQHDALAALLREARTQLYSTSTSTKYSLGLLDRIDAALKDKP